MKIVLLCGVSLLLQWRTILNWMATILTIYLNMKSCTRVLESFARALYIIKFLDKLLLQLWFKRSSCAYLIHCLIESMVTDVYQNLYWALVPVCTFQVIGLKLDGFFMNCSVIEVLWSHQLVFMDFCLFIFVLLLVHGMYNNSSPSMPMAVPYD